MEASLTNVVVTGSQGFVGRAVAEAFCELGWYTVGTGRRALDPQARAQHQHVIADLSRPLQSDMRRVIAEADVVVHAAARSSPWGSRRQFERNNVHATAQLLEACEHAAERPKFLFISSSSVYYRAEDQFGIDESTPPANPAVNMYAHSKQLAEALVREYPGRWCILRPRAVYGRGDSVLFPRILRAAMAGRLPLLVRSDQPVVGDLISIHNLVQCIVQAAAEPSICGEYNLTDDQPVPVIEFLSNVLRRLDLPIPRRQVSVVTAYRIAWWLEKLYGSLCPWIEPPITRFGVHVFAYSKTFDVSKMRRTFGPPEWSVDTSVEDFVEWVREAKPYEQL